MRYGAHATGGWLNDPSGYRKSSLPTGQLDDGATELGAGRRHSRDLALSGVWPPLTMGVSARAARLSTGLSTSTPSASHSATSNCAAANA